MTIIDTAIGRVKDPLERFMAFAKERHGIYVKRHMLGVPQPWTDDPILAHYRFTNVFRELDATTKWCKRYVRDPLDGQPTCLLAVVLFRWFNRVTTGETLFCQPGLLGGGTAWEQHLVALDARGPAAAVQALDARGPAAAVQVLRAALAKQPAPHVTGAYTINTAGLGNGLTKVEGVLAQYDSFLRRDWRVRAEQMMVPTFNHTMEGTCIWLRETPGLGGFMAYEIACDLRYTKLLRHAADRCTWANAGPGANRGLNRVVRGAQSSEEGLDRHVPAQQAVDEMVAVLAQVPKHWPADWGRWELREVEHTLCEFDKYERARLGQGRPRGVFSRG